MSDALKNLSETTAGLVEQAEPSIVRVEARRRLAATGVVWSSDGLIVTANHVVERDDNIMLSLTGGNAVNATLVGRDPNSDLAVLRAASSGLAAGVWAATDDLHVGHIVLALGRPGQSVQATLGVISALGGAWRTRQGPK